ncbi:MAG: magnesium transporter CorA family protein [Oscillospiraceae bacterium]|nr:magnesium transporter CorA family protein [Oscillospiraceae bacterium]
MMTIHKTMGEKMARLEAIEEGCWIALTDPTEAELAQVAQELEVEPDFLRAALDEEETSRIDTEEGQTLIIVDTPAMETGKSPVAYFTLPLGIIVTERCIVTVTLRESPVLQNFAEGRVRGVSTGKRTRFILHILLQVAKQYLQYLKQIDKLYNHMERQLYKSQRNRELIQLLDLEKSLVYFNTSLKANEVTLEKILRGRIVTLYEEDHDLLEDVLIEVRQAIEMAQIYSSIISGMMDAFASVISNNLNVIMKVLTSITILLTVPNIVFSFYGMNVAGLPLDQFWWFPLTLSVALIALIGVLLKKKDLF